MSEPKTSLEIIAPTVDEAIARGAAELGMPKENLDVEVLDEGGKGILGIGARQARVRLTVRQPAVPIEPPSPAGRAEPGEVAKGPPISAEEDERSVQIARDTVNDLLERMGIRAMVTARWGEIDEFGKIQPLLVDIRGKDLSVLIGRRGETLADLQYITRLIVGKEMKQPVAVVIDVEGYRARRERQLRQLARRMADQVIERQQPIPLEPMPANERRIIHLELRDHPQVYTESVGEGNHRKVTIYPRS